MPAAKPLVLLVALLFAQTAAQPEPYAFLRRHLGFTSSELSSLEKGEIIVKLPKTAETREVAAFAIMRLDVPEDFFIDRVRDIVRFKTSSNVLQIGKFSKPPRIEDLADLTLDQVDLESLRRCRPGSCDVKLPARSIERFRKEVNWSVPSSAEQATTLAKKILLEHVESYLRGGNPALGEYNDKSYPLKLAEEFGALLQPAHYMYGYEPQFQKYLEDFPRQQPAGVEDFVYWSKEKFGLKPVISLTHVMIYRRNSTAGIEYLIGSKGIYATHYFEASLGLTGFIRSQAPGAARSYLIYINRSRTDALRGFFGGLKRSLITGSLRDGAKRSMEMIKEKLETAHRK